MKKAILFILLLPLIGCLTTNEVYLPHTSRVFHKEGCVALNDPKPIKYASAQEALNTGGVAACSICIKDKDLQVKHAGYTSINYANAGTANNSLTLPPAQSSGSWVSQVLIGILGLFLMGMADVINNPQPVLYPNLTTYQDPYSDPYIDPYADLYPPIPLMPDPPPIPNYTPVQTYSSSYYGGYPSSSYNTLNPAYSTTTPSYNTSSSVFDIIAPGTSPVNPGPSMGYSLGSNPAYHNKVYKNLNPNYGYGQP